MVKDFKTICIWSARVVMFLCWPAGKMWQVNYFFSPPFIGTNWFPPHSFISTPVLPSFHDLTSARKHVLPPIAEKFRVLFFSTIQTKHNSQSTTYCYRVLWGALECYLSWLVLPWGRTSAPLKICPFWQNFALVRQVVRTCFCDCLTKCIARATRTNHKTTASLFSWIVWQVIGLKKRIRTCFL